MRYALLSLPFLMSACADPPATPDACLALRPYLPIQVDQQDTTGTKKSVLRANIAHREACDPPVIKPWSTIVTGPK